MAVAVDVREHRGRHQPDVLELRAVLRVEREVAVAIVSEQSRRGVDWIPHRNRARADEQIEIAVAVIISEGEWSRRGLVRSDELSAGATEIAARCRNSDRGRLAGHFRKTSRLPCRYAREQRCRAILGKAEH